MMTPKEIVKRTVTFDNPERLPFSIPEKNGNEFFGVGMTPSSDWRPSGKAEDGSPYQIDEWGAVWENIGVCNLGEVKEYPLKDWKDLETMKIPDIKAPHRWKQLKEHAEASGDKFLMAGGISLYERVHFIRGLENTWMDIYENPEELKKLIT